MEIGGHVIRNLCVITAKYPTPQKPTEYTFVDQLVSSFADIGVNVTVIVPYNVVREKKTKYIVLDKVTSVGNTFRVIQPPMFSASSKQILGIHTGRITQYLFDQAVIKTIKKYKINPDAIYSHFLVPSGITAVKVGKKLNKPCFCAFGESSLWSVNQVGLEYARKRLSNLTGVISVSTHNKKVLVDNRISKEDVIGVFPNGVNHTLFMPLDKNKSRGELGFDLADTIGIYTGTFSKSKGSLRTQEAAKQIKGLKMIYIGGGAEEPNGENIIFKGKVKHDDIPKYLSSADFFVLPTLQEGCCNAIIEAMACGLPVISSDLPFNYDILDSKCAILVDPNDVQQIKDAVSILVNKKSVRSQMAIEALKKSGNFDVKKRAVKILEFMESFITKGD